MPPLEGGSVKKFGVSVALLEPLDARFLSPQNLFLGFPVLQLVAYRHFLGFKIFRESVLLDMSLHHAHLICQLLLGFENVAKVLPIPYFELLLEIFDLLLEAVHLGAVRYRCLPPPLMDLLLEILGD
jgi:hypothetical protein